MAQTKALSNLLLYCRCGFENECAQEISAQATAVAAHGYIRCTKDSGYAQYVLDNDAAADALALDAPWRKLIFPRQVLRAIAEITELDKQDRLTPILDFLHARDQRFSQVWVEPPDTDSGKELATFCRKFSGALVSGLKRLHLLDAAADFRLHVFFPQSDHAILAYCDPQTSAPWPQGIPRLKFPHEAPSRSTLKLDEAFQVLLTEAERERWLNAGMKAVDLGAAPGGWTWQLVSRSIHVTAVDNAAMAPALIDSGLVTHVRGDGFTYRPKRPVDWLVCDMVEQPRRVAELITFWLAEGLCQRTIFNLKLPMKKRYAEVELCFSAIQNELAERNRTVEIRAKQLYHDREEITVFAQLAPIRK